MYGVTYPMYEEFSLSGPHQPIPSLKVTYPKSQQTSPRYVISSLSPPDQPIPGMDFFIPNIEAIPPKLSLSRSNLSPHPGSRGKSPSYPPRPTPSFWASRLFFRFETLTATSPDAPNLSQVSTNLSYVWNFLILLLNKPILCMELTYPMYGTNLSYVWGNLSYVWN